MRGLSDADSGQNLRHEDSAHQNFRVLAHEKLDKLLVTPAELAAWRAMA
jgi:hypothetical protein